jgi:hypothetical protein
MDQFSRTRTSNSTARSGCSMTGGKYGNLASSIWAYPSRGNTGSPLPNQGRSVRPNLDTPVASSANNCCRQNEPTKPDAPTMRAFRFAAGVAGTATLVASRQTRGLPLRKQVPGLEQIGCYLSPWGCYLSPWVLPLPLLLYLSPCWP